MPTDGVTLDHPDDFDSLSSSVVHIRRNDPIVVTPVAHISIVGWLANPAGVPIVQPNWGASVQPYLEERIASILHVVLDLLVRMGVEDASDLREVLLEVLLGGLPGVVVESEPLVGVQWDGLDGVVPIPWRSMLGEDVVLVEETRAAYRPVDQLIEHSAGPPDRLNVFITGYDGENRAMHTGTRTALRYGNKVFKLWRCTATLMTSPSDGVIEQFIDPRKTVRVGMSLKNNVQGFPDEESLNEPETYLDRLPQSEHYDPVLEAKHREPRIDS